MRAEHDGPRVALVGERDDRLPRPVASLDEERRGVEAGAARHCDALVQEAPAGVAAGVVDSAAGPASGPGDGNAGLQSSTRDSGSHTCTTMAGAGASSPALCSIACRAGPDPSKQSKTGPLAEDVVIRASVAGCTRVPIRVRAQIVAGNYGPDERRERRRREGALLMRRSAGGVLAQARRV